MLVISKSYLTKTDNFLSY